MDTNTETSKVVIDPDGDVVLVLHDGTELQVSSKALSLASSVFKAMFGPHLQEGQDLSGTSPKRISLPEDHPAAMTTLCNVLHHQHNSVSKTLMESELVNVAAACDKYDCSEAFSLWSPIWTLTRSSELKGVAKLLYPSFLLDDAKSFKQLSVLTVLHTEGFIDKPKNTDPMPDGVFEVLRRKKRELERRLCHDLENSLNPILKNQFWADHIESKQTDAWFNIDEGVKLFTHLKSLKDLGVWPLSSAFDGRSIATVCTTLATYKTYTRKFSHSLCTCSACMINLAQEMKRIGSDAMESFEGLCLACIKLGDTGTNVFRKCQVHTAANVGGSSTE